MDLENRDKSDYKYSATSGGELIIIDYCGDSEHLCIPATIDGRPVTQIGPFAFYDNSTIKTVVIPEGVREIEINAFENCTALSSVTIPNTVTAIGDSAFAGCSSLQSVVIPVGVQELADQIFENCSSLNSVVLPDGLESIGCNVFENCTSLTRILLPKGLKHIEQNVFENCTSLTQIDLPDSVEFIGNAAFSGCSRLNRCNIPNGIVHMGYWVFAGCDNLVLDIAPGNFREAYAKRYNLPFTSREDSPSCFIKRSPAGKLIDTLYKLSTNYEYYRQIAKELPAMDVMIQEERSGSWEKEDGRWVLHEGFAKTIWTFGFHQDYVWNHLEEALLRALFSPDAEIEFPWKTLTPVYEDIFFSIKYFPQLKLTENYTVLCRDPEPKYGAITTWIAVSDNQIAVIEEFLYD